METMAPITPTPKESRWWHAACAQDDTATTWMLLVMPVLLATNGESPSLGSVLFGAGAVLVLAIAYWATGLGRAGHLAETGFGAVWLAGWISTVGAFAALGGAPQTTWGWTLVGLGMASGAALLLGAYVVRSRQPVLAPSRRAGRGARMRQGILIAIMAFTLAVLLLLFDEPRSFHPGDLLVILTAVGFYIALSVRGRGRSPRRRAC